MAHQDSALPRALESAWLEPAHKISASDSRAGRCCIDCQFAVEGRARLNRTMLLTKGVEGAQLFLLDCVASCKSQHVTLVIKKSNAIPEIT